MRSNPKSKKAILKRIDLANKWIAFSQKHEILGSGYFGSTMESVFKYPHKITVSPKKNRATLRYKDAYWPYDKTHLTFNLNDTDEYSDTGVSGLRYEISNFIIKAIKRGANEAGIPLPSYR
jgi:hypothetical protein|tara:strand:+ start:14310 stop:14672 length:363 start_codon:yes stop_codon:yes gene_type:complete